MSITPRPQYFPPHAFSSYFFSSQRLRRGQQRLLLGLLLCLLLFHSTPLTLLAQSGGTTTPLRAALKRTAQSAADYVKEGEALLEGDDYAGAIAAFDQALALDDTLVRAYVGRGQAYWLQDEYEQALADLNQAIALTTEDADTYAIRGAVYNSLGDYPTALEDFDQSLALDPDDTWALAYRGYTHYRADHYEQALIDLDRALKFNPSYVWAIVVRGNTYHMLGEYTKARLDLTRAISLDPSNDWAYATRGSVYRVLGEYEKALADLNQALALTPDYWWAMQDRGATYQALGDTEKALADFDAVIAAEPTNDWTLAQRGFLYFEQEQYAAALADFDSALAVNPDYDWALAQRGQTHQAVDDHDAALVDFNAALALAPDNGWYLALRADLYRIMSLYDEALTDANQAVVLTPDDEFVWGVRGYTYRMLERYEEAVADFTQAITIDPTYAWAYTMRGELHQLLGRDEEALTDFEEANRLNGIDSPNAAIATPEPTPAAPLGATIATETTPATAAPAGAVQSLADAQQAVIQIEAVGSFSSPQEEGPAVKAGSGTGFIIDPSGIAVTNNHVVTGGAVFKVYVDGRAEALNARVLGVSECADLAVIDIEGDGFSYVSWYDGEITVGLDVYAAGYPLGDPEYTLTRGIIAKARANGQTAWSSLDQVLQHDADINPGNSGGPLLTDQGQVVGVNYAVNAEFRQSFAIGRAEALPIIEQLRQGQDVDALGINGEALSDGANLHGIWVYSVQSGSPADQAGVQGGDFILSLENIGMATDGTMGAYCEVVRSHSPADTLNIEVYRRATSEFCTGQINGRPLACTPADAPAADTPTTENPAAAPTPTPEPHAFPLETVQHESGDFAVRVPAEWQTSESVTTAEYQQLMIGDEAESSGVVITLSRDQSMNVEEMAARLDQMRREFEQSSEEGLSGCTYRQRQSLTHDGLQGVYDQWDACGPNQNLLLNIIFMPAEGQTFLASFIVFWPTTWDLAHLDQMLASLTLDPGVAIAPQAPVAAAVLVQSKILNVRNGPGTNYRAIGQVNQGAQLTVIAQAYNCTWLQVQLPDNQQGWIAGQPPYASLTGDCAIIPQGSIPPAPIGGGGGSGGGNGCILFQNHFNDEATVTLTGKDGRYNQTFTVGRKANDRHCVAPGGYTYTIDVPPPWGSINGELDIQRGRTITFPIYGN